jgi:hypothetical protein
MIPMGVCGSSGTEQVQWSRVKPGKEEFKSMMVKRTLIYV